MANTHTYIHIRDSDHVTVDTIEGNARVRIDRTAMFVTPTVARTLAAGLMIAADQLDPQPVDA